MGKALLEGWTARGIAPVWVVEPAPSPELKSFVRRHGIVLRCRIDETVEMRPRACVVALKPQILRSEAIHLRPIAESGALMISIAAGISIAALRNGWGRRAQIVRAMPNMPGAIGKGISALYAPRGTDRGSRLRTQRLLAGLGETLWVNREEFIDVATAVSGSGPAYVFLFAECLARAAQMEGLPVKIAERLARSTIEGAGALLLANRRDPAALRGDVASPGGTTEAGLSVLMYRNALPRLVAEAVAAARGRALELRRNR